MPRKKKSEVVGTVEVPEMVTNTTAEPKTSWDIFDDADQYVRTYSIEVHGANAHALALMYLEGHPKCRIV
jgi:hypothetical protein